MKQSPTNLTKMWMKDLSRHVPFVTDFNIKLKLYRDAPVLFSHPRIPHTSDCKKSQPTRRHQWSDACKKPSMLMRCGLTPPIGVKAIQLSPELVTWTAQFPLNSTEWLGGLSSQHLYMYWRAGSLAAASKNAPSFRPVPSTTLSNISDNTISTINRSVAPQAEVPGKHDFEAITPRTFVAAPVALIPLC